MSSSRTSSRSSTRRPLHERADSQTDQLTTPTIRLVDDAHVYGANPFPFQPAYILRPPGDSNPVSGRPPGLSQPSLNLPHTPPQPSSEPSEPGYPITLEDYASSPQAPAPARASAVEEAGISNIDATDLATVVSREDGHGTLDKPSRQRRSSGLMRPDILPPTGPRLEPPRRPAQAVTLPPVGLSEKGVRSVDVSSVAADHLAQSSSSLYGSTPQQSIPPAPLTDAPLNQMRAGRASTRYSAFPPVTPPNPLKSCPLVVPLPARPAGPRSRRSPSAPKPHARPSPDRSIVAVPAEAPEATECAAVVQYPTVRPPSAQSSRATTSTSTPERSGEKEEESARRSNAGRPPEEYDRGAAAEEKADDERKLEITESVAEPVVHSPRVLPQGLVGVALTSDLEAPLSPNVLTRDDQRASTIRVVSGPQLHGDPAQHSWRRSTRAQSFPLTRPTGSRRTTKMEMHSDSGDQDSIVYGVFPAWARYAHQR